MQNYRGDCRDTCGVPVSSACAEEQDICLSYGYITWTNGEETHMNQDTIKFAILNAQLHCDRRNHDANVTRNSG